MSFFELQKQKVLLGAKDTTFWSQYLYQPSPKIEIFDIWLSGFIKLVLDYLNIEKIKNNERE